MKSFTFVPGLLALLSSAQAVALPHIDPNTPIPLNMFKLRTRAGQDPHMGIDADTIRKYTLKGLNQASPTLGKRVIDFDPVEQLVDGEFSSSLSHLGPPPEFLADNQ